MKAAEKAYEVLRRGILDGTYGARSRVTEQEVAAEIGVSRTPVREAMRRLQAEGLIRFVPNQGAVVASWSTAELREIFELRALLESYGAERAAQYASAADLKHLRELASRQCAVTATLSRTSELAEIADLNSEFHQGVQELAGAKRLGAMVSQLVEVPLVAQTFHSYGPEQLQQSARHHLEIVAALEARDGASAGAIMRAHVLAAKRVLVDQVPLEKENDPSGDTQPVGLRSAR